MQVDILQASTTEMLLLLLLSKEDAHGYQLSQMLEEHSKGKLCVKIASLYPILYKLEEKGYISSRTYYVERKSTIRPGRSARGRIVYHIEQPGIERIEQLLDEHAIFVEGCADVISFAKKGGDFNEK